MKVRSIFCFVLTLLLAVACRADVVAPAAPALLPPDAVVATFDRDADLPATAMPSARATRDADAQAGGGSLKIAFHATDPVVPPELRLPLTGGIDSGKTASLSLQARASVLDDAKEVRVRIGLNNDAGRLILQRTFIVPTDGQWHAVTIPLDRFRWGKIAGGWKEARSIQLAIESPFRAVWFDEVKLLPNPPKVDPPADRLRKLAFANRDVRVAEADGLLVATDAPELAEPDVARMLGNMRRTRAMVRRLFGEAAHPIDTTLPAALLVFKDQQGYTGFWQTMNRFWGARIVPPPNAGYTLQDIATSSYDAKLGNDRPVWLHESVHAVVGRDLRLAPGTVEHSWLQEGLANYVQLCVYPKSLENAAFPRLFAAGVQDRPQSLFRPLRQVLTERVTSKQYAQLASLTAFLIEIHPDWLPKLATQISNGMPIEKVLTDVCRADFDALEKEWLQWGRKRFAAPRQDGHFATPVEWTK